MEETSQSDEHFPLGAREPHERKRLVHLQVETRSKATGRPVHMGEARVDLKMTKTRVSVTGTVPSTDRRDVVEAPVTSADA